MNKPKYKVPTQPVWAKVAAILAYAAATLFALFALGLYALGDCCLNGMFRLQGAKEYMEELRV